MNISGHPIAYYRKIELPMVFYNDDANDDGDDDSSIILASSNISE